MSKPFTDSYIEDEPLETGDLQGVVDIGAIQTGDSTSSLVKGLLRSIGEDPEREGLLKTPYRFDKALKYLTKGYAEDLTTIVNDAIYATDAEDLVLVRDIDIFSLCEHHMLPFFGKVHIAYVPDGRVIGISKLPRIAEMFARRLQLQERLTAQIAGAVESVLNPKGVSVVIECSHLCMVMRGIQKVGTTTVTRSLTGVFKEDESLRRDTMKMIRGETV